MKTKLFTLLLAVAASVGTILAWDYERVQIGDLYYNLDATNKTAEVTSSDRDQYSGDIVIPSSVTYNAVSYSVTSIGEYAFCYCYDLTSITIPNSVTSIGGGSKGGTFEGCSGLTSPVYNAHVFAYMPTSYSGAYTIPDGIESIADYAFEGCSSLTSITIPNSVTSIGDFAFFRCTGLTSVNIGNSVTSIGQFAFSECESLTSITIPNSVTSIGDAAFLECTGLTSVTIPNSVTSIGVSAFSRCKGLTSVTILNGVTSIGSYAFYNCSSLKSLTLGASVKVLDEKAFANCTSIETITCYNMRPPTIKEYALEYVPYSAIVYVPAAYLNNYLMHDAWGLYDVRPMGATPTDVTKVDVTPSENTAYIVWPKVSGAASYELVIKDKNGKVVCTLVFDAEGRLLSIAFNAPARDNMPQQTQVAGFAFTVTGLNSGTTYNYSIASKDSNGNTLNTESGSFKTTGESTGLQNVTDQLYETKFFRNGQLFIQRDGKTYSITGQEVK